MEAPPSRGKKEINFFEVVFLLKLVFTFGFDIFFEVVFIFGFICHVTTMTQTGTGERTDGKTIY